MAYANKTNSSIMQLKQYTLHVINYLMMLNTILVQARNLFKQ